MHIKKARRFGRAFWRDFLRCFRRVPASGGGGTGEADGDEHRAHNEVADGQGNIEELSVPVTLLGR